MRSTLFPHPGEKSGEQGRQPARPARGPGRHCTCPFPWPLNPSHSGSATPNRHRMLSAGTSLLQTHHAVHVGVVTCHSR